MQRIETFISLDEFQDEYLRRKEAKEEITPFAHFAYDLMGFLLEAINGGYPEWRIREELKVKKRQ